MSATSGGFRRDIQGLRAIAVIAVVLDHLLHWPSGGFVGVDVFFVISGFLITGLLLREHERTGRISFSAFYRNRVRRILPAAALVLTVTIAASWMIYSAERRLSILSDGGWSAWFAANWHFAMIGTDYFGASGPPSPLQHFWSLAVEEQFYLVWPVVIVVVLAVTARFAGARKRAIGSALAVVLIGLVVASFGWALFESATAPTWAYFSTFSRAWELGVGGLLALFAGRFARIPGRFAPLLCVGGLAGIFASIALLSNALPFPGPWAILPVVATAAVIVSGMNGRLRSAWLLTNPVAQYTGRVSYSLYLWHFPVIVIGSSLIGVGVWQSIVLSILMCVIAVYAFHLVEEPIRTSGWLRERWPRPGWPRRGRRSLRRRSQGWQGQGQGHGQEQGTLAGARQPRDPHGTHAPGRTLVALSFLALVAVGTTGAALANTAPRAVTAGTETLLSSLAGDGDAEDVERAPDAQLSALRAELSIALEETSWSELTPSMDEALNNRVAADDVIACATATVIDEKSCTWGDPAAPKTVLIAGNSIATGFVTTFIDALRAHPEWKVISYARIACPFGNPTINGDEVPPGCAERADRVVEAVNRLQPDLVAIAGVTDVQGVGSKLDAMTADSTIALLTMPVADKPMNACYTRMNSPQDCISTHEAPRGASIHQKLANSAPDKRVVIDTVPWFCVDGRCPPTVGTTLIKSDDRHMTPEYASRLAPLLHEALVTLGIVEGAPVTTDARP
ncbi:hypothetical protein GCM10027406_24070 [Leifsonia lichenia]